MRSNAYSFIKGSSFTLFASIVTSVLVLSGQAFAKTDKFARPTPAPAASPAADGSSPTSAASPAPGSDKTASGEKKVDLTDLENRYWTAKDTEFSVVQNRLYTKAKKLSFTLTTGPLLTDLYTTAWNLGGAINYYFSERTGIELQGWKTSASNNDVTNNFINRFQVDPDHNLATGYIGASYNWIPIYAKLSLLEKKILYFDFSISPGIGATFLSAETYSRTTAPPPQINQTAPTLALDIAEQVFLSEHWALRIDVRNHFYQEQIYNTVFQNQDRTKFTYSGTVMLGATFFQ